MTSHREETIASSFAKNRGLWYGKWYQTWYVGTKRQLELLGINKIFQ